MVLTHITLGGIAAHHIAAGVVGIIAAYSTSQLDPQNGSIKPYGWGTLKQYFLAVLQQFSLLLSLLLVLCGTETLPLPSNCLALPVTNGIKATSVKKFSAASKLTLLKVQTLDQAWSQIPEKLAFYDYVGNSPAKGGLFRTGPMVKGDGIAQSWQGHAVFKDRRTGIDRASSPQLL